MRALSVRVRDPQWLIQRGLSEASTTSMAVLSPAWLTSMTIPVLFIRFTASYPRSVSPPSPSSLNPDPRVFDSLYTMPMERTPSPNRRSILSTSLSIAEACSMVWITATLPSLKASVMSSTFSAGTTKP